LSKTGLRPKASAADTARACLHRPFSELILYHNIS
jgi:hypothetical protein